jgi:aspartate dehydrogenase
MTVDEEANGICERIVVIGMGAMGKRVATALQTLDAASCKFCCLVPSTARETDLLKQTYGVEVFHDFDALIAWRPTVAVECAGHAAVRDTVTPLLAHGVDVILVSVGALASAALREQIDAAAKAGAARLTLVSGAIGGIDALHAARIGGLDFVRYTGRKPPRAWLGSPAESQFDLLAIDRPTVIFEGSAGESARLYPKNANVTAAVALAGVGFDDTAVAMIADPGIDRNVHEVEAVGAFGHLSIRLENNPLPDNPRTSWLAAMSVEEAIFRRLEHSI